MRSGRRSGPGLAASTKYNAGLIVLAGLWSIWSAGTAPRLWTDRSKLLAMYCVIAAVAFIAGTPYAILDWRSFLTALGEVTAHLRDGHVAPAGPAWQVHLTSSLRHGLGWPLLLAGVGGLPLFIWRERRAGTLLAIFPVTYFAIIGSGQTTFARYIIPLIPFLCLSAAYFVVEVARAIGRLSLRPQVVPFLVCALAAGVAVPAAWSSIRLDELLSRTDNRLIAAEWIREQFPGGITLYQTASQYGHLQMQTAEAGARRALS